MSLRNITYNEAIREALREEMRRDEDVYVIGEDVGKMGGIFRATDGLLEDFGPRRIVDTPITEAGFIGLAIGSTLLGLRPVVEIMYLDFITICMDQLVNHASCMRFMSGGQLKVPLVVRTQYSLGRTYGAQHTRFIPSWFVQVPGLKVVAPSTPYDAKGLLKSSIRDDNPTVFIEAGVLYGTRGPVPEGEYNIPIGKADVKIEGSDVTIAAVSRTVHEAIAAADELDKDKISAEVLDLRTLYPLDKGALVNSVKKTGRLVAIADDAKHASITTEIAATVFEEAFDYLDAPIVRVTSPHVPVPFSGELEAKYMVNKDKIVSSVKTMLS